MTGLNSGNSGIKGEFISPAEFANLMDPLGLTKPSPHLAIGVSGGADSMALAVLSQEWMTGHGGKITALIFDHGLRTDSDREAKQVAGWLADRGIQSEILSWQGPKPATGIQAAARAARYGAMTRWCTAHNVTELLIAHHRDDQAETFMLRLGRASGIDGLACMGRIAPSPIPGNPNIQLVRPLLPVAKSRLIATLKHRNVPWVEDPSNQNTSFTRVRLRVMLKNLADEGFTSERLSVTARRMERARDALRTVTQEFLTRSVVRDPAGFCEISMDDFRHAPEEISLRALSQMLVWAGGQSTAPRLERAERLHRDLMAARDFSGRTLGGCRVEVLKRRHGRCVFVCREAQAATHVLPLSAGDRVQWDGRFQVGLENNLGIGHRAELPQVRRLGEAGWRQIASDIADRVRLDIPVPARSSLPALWDRDGVLSVPLADYLRPWTPPFLATFKTEISWNRDPNAHRQGSTEFLAD